MASAGDETGGVGQSVSSPRPPPGEETGGLAFRVAAADGHGDGFRRDPGARDGTQATLLQDIEVGMITLQRLEAEFHERKFLLDVLQSTSTELDNRKTDLFSEIQMLCQRFKNEGPGDVVQRLMSVLEMLKDLERQESDFQSSFEQKYASRQEGIMELEQGIYTGDKNKVDVSALDKSIMDAQEKLNLAKSELGSKLRAILSLKRRIDDVPAQTELIQYEHRFSELYVQIQERLRRTRKHYDTYNALLDIKELMLKEISLLNSISSQFQEAMVDIAGRSKLMDSMETIMKGTQQKLEKVDLGLRSEQKAREALKEKYSAAIAEQRHFSYLLKSFQEECARNERLRSPTRA